jgi:hypothetical protein
MIPDMPQNGRISQIGRLRNDKSSAAKRQRGGAPADSIPTSAGVASVMIFRSGAT